LPGCWSSRRNTEEEAISSNIKDAIKEHLEVVLKNSFKKEKFFEKLR